MKNSKLVKMVLVVMIILIMILVAGQVFAETDLTPSLMGGSSSGGVNVLDISNTPKNNTVNNATNNTINNTVLTTNNTSNYNNTSLPKTGIEDSVPGAILVVVLGISAVYAYKKMQDYKNI